jgi:hypothetical protein
METLWALLTIAGIGYGLYRGIRWMVRSGRSLPPREQPLTPNDLKVLEESAHRLMADLRAVSDECVAKVEAACELAQRLMKQREFAPQQVPKHEAPASEPDPPRSGMLIGEVELLKGLQEIVHR